ncbi:MAG: hypothetical protein MJ106_03135 [Lentisphaeria bacterium]|nr:hypothetical protein [Lentisphaeria bacterium]
MRICLIIPTDDEAVGLPPYPYIACGFGAGKSAACAMAADLIFKNGCDTILIWGTAGGLSQRAQNGVFFIGKYLAHGDYDVRPLYNSTGVGFVKNITDANGWITQPDDLNACIAKAFAQVFPEIKLYTDGRLCSSDKFAMPANRQDYNRIEAASDAIDMESAAVAEFIHHLNTSGSAKNIRLAVIRAISNQATTFDSSDTEFMDFLPTFNKLNTRLPQLLNAL